MGTDKDLEQDELIRRNAEHIARNEEAIHRQTECLEKIREHYYPKRSWWKNLFGLFLKAVGAVTVAAGLLEAWQWLWDTHKNESMAAHCAEVAKRLFLSESNPEGAACFLDKALELDGENLRYRTMQAYIRGLSTLGEYANLGRPLLPAEREKVDGILAEALYLQEIAPDNPMSYVLTAQARLLRGELKDAQEAVSRAVELGPDNMPALVNHCAVLFASGKMAAAREAVARAESVRADFPLVLFWKGQLAAVADRDFEAAERHFAELTRRAPQMPLGHIMRGRALQHLKRPDFAAARDEFATALRLAPRQKLAMLYMADGFEREGNLVLARLWLDQVLKQDPNCMGALCARARIDAAEGAYKAAEAGLSSAIALSPFDEGLYRERAAVRAKLGDAAAAEADLKTAEALKGAK